MGGAVTLAVGSALYSGLKKEPAPCDLCMGTGGTQCFACEGGGKNMSVSLEKLQEETRQRDPVGRSVNPRECRVCKGAGLVLCSKCRGKGYMS